MIKTILSFISISIITNCSIADTTYFFKPAYQKEYEITSDNIKHLDYVYNIDRYKIAIGVESGQEIDLSSLFVINDVSKELIYISDPVHRLYGSNIYYHKKNNTIIILWEVKQEIASDLLLFVISNDGLVEHLGAFDIISYLNSDNKLEDLSYPVDKIEITYQDQIVFFDFRSKAILYPYNSLQELNNDMDFRYMLDIETFELSVHKQ